jgi:hypothetical protein
MSNIVIVGAARTAVGSFRLTAQDSLHQHLNGQGDG